MAPVTTKASSSKSWRLTQGHPPFTRVNSFHPRLLNRLPVFGLRKFGPNVMWKHWWSSFKGGWEDFLLSEMRYIISLCICWFLDTSNHQDGMPRRKQLSENANIGGPLDHVWLVLSWSLSSPLTAYSRWTKLLRTEEKCGAETYPKGKVCQPHGKASLHACSIHNNGMCPSFKGFKFCALHQQKETWWLTFYTLARLLYAKDYIIRKYIYIYYFILYHI